MSDPIDAGHPTRAYVKSRTTRARLTPWRALRHGRLETASACLLHLRFRKVSAVLRGRAADTVYEQRRVLIVEDEVRLRCYLAMSLEARGVEVEQAGSLAEAHALLERLDFDAVVLDVGLPDGDGLTLLERSPADRALVITANPDPTRFAACGVLHHLTKPLDLPQFVGEVDNLTSREGSR